MHSQDKKRCFTAFIGFRTMILCRQLRVERLPATGKQFLVRIDFASWAQEMQVHGPWTWSLPRSAWSQVDAEQVTAQTQQLFPAHLQKEATVEFPIHTVRHSSTMFNLHCAWKSDCPV